jgi:hypothetical protein
LIDQFGGIQGISDKIEVVFEGHEAIYGLAANYSINIATAG